MALKVTITQLKEHICDFTGCQIISLDTQTNVKLKGGKSNPYQGRVMKVTRGINAMIFKSGVGYENMINTRLKQEYPNSPDYKFESGPRRWGQRLNDTPIIQHTDNEYLEYIALNSGVTTYYLDGDEISKSLIEEYLPPVNNGEQGGIQNKVIIRTPKLESILRVKKAGVDLILE